MNATTFSLTSDFTANVNVQLAVGNISETVSVVAESPAVDIQNARVQYVFKGDDIADLPTERDLGGLLNLVPSVTTNQGTCTGGIGAFCNGIAPAFNSHVSAHDADGQNQGRIVVDGMTINRGAAPQGINLNTGATNGIAFDTANVQELTFTLSGALGESETGGASITIVPRTGGNRFAGSYFTSYTNDNFFDRNRETRLSNTPATQDLVKDFDVNGSFGGPIKRNRLWFFVHGAHARRREVSQRRHGRRVREPQRGQVRGQLPAAARRWHQGLLAHVYQRAEEHRRAAHAAGLPEKQVQPRLGRAGRVHEPLQGHDQHRRFSRELFLAAEPAEPPAVRLVDEPVHEQDPVRGRHHRREHASGLDPPPRVPEPPRASAHLRSRVRQPAWTRSRRR